jgi:hypothetical protein
MTHLQGREGTAMARIQGQRIRDELITPGVIIVYTLRPDQRPRHPEKEWRGKVLHYDRVFQRATVESLEAGYEGCEEGVWLKQFTRIETLVDTSSSLRRKED